MHVNQDDLEGGRGDGELEGGRGGGPQCGLREGMGGVGQMGAESSDHSRSFLFLPEMAR